MVEARRVNAAGQPRYTFLTPTQGQYATATSARRSRRQKGTPHAYEGELGTVVFIPYEDRIAVRPDGKLHPHGERAGWVFRPEELELLTE